MQIPHRCGIDLLELGELLRLDELFYEHKMGYIVGHGHSTKEYMARVWILSPSSRDDLQSADGLRNGGATITARGRRRKLLNDRGDGRGGGERSLQVNSRENELIPCSAQRTVIRNSTLTSRFHLQVNWSYYCPSSSELLQLQPSQWRIDQASPGEPNVVAHLPNVSMLSRGRSGVSRDQLTSPPYSPTSAASGPIYQT